MFLVRMNAAAVFAMVLFHVPAVLAADSARDIKQRMGSGDPVAGKSKVTICKVCHGEDGNSTSSNYPKLAGQYADYIVKQVHDFKSGLRKDPMMSAMVQSIGSDQDMLDIAAYYASLNQMEGSRPVSNSAGKALYNQEGSGCVSCHGIDGKGLAPDQSHAPVIGGQYKNYLVKQLKHFRQGTRANDPGGIMVMVAGVMSDEDIENVASYISGL